MTNDCRGTKKKKKKKGMTMMTCKRMGRVRGRKRRMTYQSRSLQQVAFCQRSQGNTVTVGV